MSKSWLRISRWVRKAHPFIPIVVDSPLPLPQECKGTIVTDMAQAHYILCNPPYANQPWYSKQLRKLENERDPENDPLPIIRPYYWIYECLYHQPPQILLSAAVYKDAVFGTKGRDGRPRPSKVYISINVPATRPEENNDGVVAAKYLESLILRHGGMRSYTRKDSDFLVLNLDTKQGKEYERNALKFQTVWNRTWLEQRVNALIPVTRGLGSGDVKLKSMVKTQPQEKT